MSHITIARRHLLTGGMSLVAGTHYISCAEVNCVSEKEIKGLISYGALYNKLKLLQGPFGGSEINLEPLAEQTYIQFLCTSSDGEAIAFFKFNHSSSSKDYVSHQIIVAVPRSGKVFRCNTNISLPTGSALWSSDGPLFVVGGIPDPEVPYPKELARYVLSVDLATGVSVPVSKRLNAGEVPLRICATAKSSLVYCSGRTIVSFNSALGDRLALPTANEIAISRDLSHCSWTNSKGELWLTNLSGQNARLLASKALGAGLWAPDSSGLCYVRDRAEMSLNLTYQNPVEYQSIEKPGLCAVGKIPMGNSSGHLGWLNCSIDVCKKFFQSDEL